MHDVRKLSSRAPAQGALALLGEPASDAAGAVRGGAATRRFGPGSRRALTGRVAALEPYIQERCGRVRCR